MSRSRLCLALVVGWLAIFRIATLNRPFDYDAEGSSSLNAVLARGYLRFDFAQTHGMPVLSLAPARATPVVYYPDHPPLVPLLIVPFYRVFGVGEWQTRLPIAVTTVAAILMLYQLLVADATPRVALVASAVFAATPMVLYFGGFADVVGMPLVFGGLLALVGYLRLQRAPGLRTWIVALSSFVPAAICDWPAYVLVPIVAVHYAATRPRRDWPWIVAFCAGACGLFVMVYAYITLATHEPWTWMADLLSRRSALVGQRTYTASQWLAAAIATNLRYHTLPLVGIAGTAMVASLRHRSRPGVTVAGLLIVWATVYAVIGAKALYDHEWAWILFTPGLAVAAALLLARLPDGPLAVALVAFAAWTTYGAYTSLYPAQRRVPFTPIQMGQAIQIAAPQPTDVALVVGTEAEAQLWFYGDRRLRTRIWSADDVVRRLDDDTVDLMFDFDVQPWKGQATGLVFPKVMTTEFRPLHEYLRQRYAAMSLPPALASEFEVYDLRHP
jgi:dolichyl-phosphate-mannose-protein mannosyltransferase